jgi:hypothetical protein
VKIREKNECFEDCVINYGKSHDPGYDLLLDNCNTWVQDVTSHCASVCSSGGLF